MPIYMIRATRWTMQGEKENLKDVGNQEELFIEASNAISAAKLANEDDRYEINQIIKVGNIVQREGSYIQDVPEPEPDPNQPIDIEIDVKSIAGKGKSSIAHFIKRALRREGIIVELNDDNGGGIQDEKEEGFVRATLDKRIKRLQEAKMKVSIRTHQLKNDIRRGKITIKKAPPKGFCK